MAFSMGVVDDDPRFRRLMVMLARARGFDAVCEASDAENALTSFAVYRPELALVDLHLPDGDGVGLARRLLQAGITAQIVLTSTDADALPKDPVEGTHICAVVPKETLAEVDFRTLLQQAPDTE